MGGICDRCNEVAIPEALPQPKPRRTGCRPAGVIIGPFNSLADVYGIMLKQRHSKETPLNSPQSTCTHHWVLESQPGPSSPGKCKLCGQTREFPNHTEQLPWRHSLSLGSAGLRDAVASFKATSIADSDDDTWTEASLSGVASSLDV